VGELEARCRISTGNGTIKAYPVTAEPLRQRYNFLNHALLLGDRLTGNGVQARLLQTN
jgi:hypothetical protein